MSSGGDGAMTEVFGVGTGVRTGWAGGFCWAGCSSAQEGPCRAAASAAWAMGGLRCFDTDDPLWAGSRASPRPRVHDGLRLPAFPLATGACSCLLCDERGGHTTPARTLPHRVMTHHLGARMVSRTANQGPLQLRRPRPPGNHPPPGHGCPCAVAMAGNLVLISHHPPPKQQIAPECRYGIVTYGSHLARSR